MKPAGDTFGDFRCIHCRMIISADGGLSGVRNRNHCPYCLWSRHLDLRSAGDRLCACKGAMRPVGLTLKRRRKKYARLCQGELMVVHECVECGSLSINRIAADDLADRLYEIYCNSQRSGRQIRTEDICLLGEKDERLVQARLFGNNLAGGQPALAM